MRRNSAAIQKKFQDKQKQKLKVGSSQKCKWSGSGSSRGIQEKELQRREQRWSCGQHWPAWCSRGYSCSSSTPSRLELPKLSTLACTSDEIRQSPQMKPQRRPKWTLELLISNSRVLEWVACCECSCLQDTLSTIETATTLDYISYCAKGQAAFSWWGRKNLLLRGLTKEAQEFWIRFLVHKRLQHSFYSGPQFLLGSDCGSNGNMGSLKFLKLGPRVFYWGWVQFGFQWSRGTRTEWQGTI